MVDAEESSRKAPPSWWSKLKSEINKLADDLRTYTREMRAEDERIRNEVLLNRSDVERMIAEIDEDQQAQDDRMAALDHENRVLHAHIARLEKRVIELEKLLPVSARKIAPPVQDPEKTSDATTLTLVADDKDTSDS